MMPRLLSAVKLLVLVIAISSIVAVLQYSHLHQQSNSRTRAPWRTSDAEPDGDSELESAELKAVASYIGIKDQQVAKDSGEASTEEDEPSEAGNPVILVKKSWENNQEEKAADAFRNLQSLHVVESPSEKDLGASVGEVKDPHIHKVDALWDDVVHEGPEVGDFHRARTSTVASTHKSMRGTRPTHSIPTVVARDNVVDEGIDNSTVTQPWRSFDNNETEGEEPRDLCPVPYTGTECSVTMLGAMGRNSTMHSGYVSVNYLKVLDWIGKTGVFLVRLSYKCDAQETLKFDVHNVTEFVNYVAGLKKGTVIVGLSGDYEMLNKNITMTVLNALGVNVDYFYRDCMYGFLAKVGYRGVTEWRKQFKNRGPLMFSKGTIKGRTFPVQLEEPTYPQLVSTYKEIGQGGHWRPTQCKPRWKVAVIIPFRDRDSHLRVWLNNLFRFLERQNLEFTIYVVEQAEPELFNRAAMMNIGYVEAKRRSYHDCYIFHDVDLIPEDMCNLYACTENPRHLAVAMNKFEYRMPYGSYFGGVISLTPENMETINGFSNVMFGWGGEDDDTAFRLSRKELPVMRYPPELGRYVMIKHSDDQGNPKSHRGMAMVSQHSLYMDVDGLNSLSYKRISYTMEPLYTRIHVKLQGPTKTEDLDGFYAMAVDEFKQALEHNIETAAAESNRTSVVL